MKSALDPRHQHRRRIVQQLFTWAFQKQPVSEETTKKIVAEISSIDQLITDSAPEFPLNRINNTDLAVLRLAVYELVIEHSQPPKVIIDEAVELAKEFGGETAPGFINGVLGKILKSPARIKKIMADCLGVEEKKLVPEADLRHDLNGADLEIHDLLTVLEKAFNLTFEDGFHPETIGDIMNFIEDYHD